MASNDRPSNRSRSGPSRPGKGNARPGESSGSGRGKGPSGRGAGPGKPGQRRSSGGDSRRNEGGGGRRSGGAPRKYERSAPRPDGEEAVPGNREWGGLARKGVLRANHDEQRSEERRHEDAPPDLDDEALAKRAEREAARVAREARTEDLRRQAKNAVERANKGAATKPKPQKKRRPPKAHERAPLPAGPARSEDEVEALHRLLGAANAKKALRKLRTAASSYEAERYADARKSLASIVEIAPGIAEVHELYGLTLYRMSRFKDAAAEMEKFRVLAATADQNPVLMDCYRGLGRWDDVAELWEELAAASPSADIVNEGRIVMAGAIADQGDLDAGVRLLAKGWRRPSRPHYHHLRRAYALADLYERSGDVPRARALFDWVLKHDRDFVDTAQRLRSLR